MTKHPDMNEAIRLELIRRRAAERARDARMIAAYQRECEASWAAREADGVTANVRAV